jgi:hypothetical protein
MKEKKDITLLILSILLALLIAITSVINICIKITNIDETTSYAAPRLGQEITNLFIIIPVLLFSSILAYYKKKTGLFIWSGTLFYLTNTYTLLSFELQYNYLFIAYFFIVGLSVFSLMYFAGYSKQESVFKTFSRKVSPQAIALFFFINTGVFYFLRLAETIPAIFD